MDNLMDTHSTALVRNISIDQMETWSEDKKKDFTNMFAARCRVARYILLQTACAIMETAQGRRFISSKHEKELREFLYERSGYQSHGFGVTNFGLDDSYFTEQGRADRARGCHVAQVGMVGGRLVAELQNIAGERAEIILSELPPLRKAVEIIDPDTAKRIDRRDALIKRGVGIREKLEPFATPIKMSSMDQAMTLGAFRDFLKQRERDRKKLIDELEELATEGSELEDLIGKALYEGLPGLSDAVIKVVKDHIERATALSETNRRVEEKVLFGDSAAAVSLLKHFEDDEVAISSDVRAQFQAALEKLKISKGQMKGLKKATPKKRGKK